MSHRGSEHQLCNDTIVDVMIMPYIMLQKDMKMATAVDHNEHARSCSNNQPFSLIWISHITNYKGAKHQQCD
jgi:hypothetical protein